MGKWLYDINDGGYDWEYNLMDLDYSVDVDKDKQIADLKAALAKAEGRNPVLDEVDKPWPKIETIYVYASKEQMRDLGERIGLRQQDIDKFKFVFNEVAVKISINDDGTYTIIEHGLK